MSRRGFFSQIAAAALAGVVVPRAVPLVDAVGYAYKENGHLFYTLDYQYRRGVMSQPLGFVWHLDPARGLIRLPVCGEEARRCAGWDGCFTSPLRPPLGDSRTLI
jgi:hypothetical protein